MSIIIFIFFIVIMISVFIIIKLHNNTINSQYYEKVLDYLENDENYIRIIKNKHLKKIGVYNDHGNFVERKAFISFIILSYGGGKLILSILYFWEVEEKDELILESIQVFEYF